MNALVIFWLWRRRQLIIEVLRMMEYVEGDQAKLPPATRVYSSGHCAFCSAHRRRRTRRRLQDTGADSRGECRRISTTDPPSVRPGRFRRRSLH